MTSLRAAVGLPLAFVVGMVVAGSPAAPGATGATGATGAAISLRAISAIGFETRLWQREFAPNHKFQASRSAETVADTDQSQQPQKSAVTMDLADPVPVAVTVEQTDAYLKREATDASVNDRMISEWDKVIANTAGKDGVGEEYTTTGPTLTTYLVAIVATIVAVGCTITPK